MDDTTFDHICNQAAKSKTPLHKKGTHIATSGQQCQALVPSSRRTTRGTMAEILVQCVNPATANGLCTHHEHDVSCIRQDAAIPTSNITESKPVKKAKTRSKKSEIIKPIESEYKEILTIVHDIRGIPFYVDNDTKSIAYSTYDILHNRINPAVIGRKDTNGEWTWV